MQRPVLVTGAGGFIGGRIVEVLHLLPDREVRAGVRRWSSAARIGRLPVEIVLCDVTDRDQVFSAMEGVGAVIHCATGGRAAAVEGIRNVLDAAGELGVERVVYFSTIDVYGDAEGDVDETRPLVKLGRDYGDSKIESERLCLEYAGQGLPVTILRPSLVYGPFGKNFTIEIAERLAAGGGFPAPKDADGQCNLVYVDDVVLASLLALQREEAIGEAFNVNGAEILTWARYLEAFGAALGVTDTVSSGRWSTNLRSLAMTPVRNTAKWALRRFEAPIRGLYKRSGMIQRVMGGMESAIRQTPTRAEYRLLRRQASFPIDKARRLLGYEPRFSLARGMVPTVAWLRHHGFLGPPEMADSGSTGAEVTARASR